MRSVAAAVKNDGHALNFALLTLGVITPAAAFYYLRAPPQAQVDEAVRLRFPEAPQRDERLATFWARRNSAQMEAVYASLLRGGTSNRKRHHGALSGPLAEAEAAADPAFAAERRALGNGGDGGGVGLLPAAAPPRAQAPPPLQAGSAAGEGSQPNAPASEG